MESVSNIIDEYSLIWGNLRNILNPSELKISSAISLIGSSKGFFPVDSYQPIQLEIPKNKKKIDISGRSNFGYSIYNKEEKRNFRSISLPIYKIEENTNINSLNKFFQLWNAENSFIPSEIPIISLSFKVKGSYSTDGREGQNILVLLVWAEKFARILELDWFEGPLDDCCTPEWYIKSSGLIEPSRAIQKVRSMTSHASSWENPSYSLFANPWPLGNYNHFGQRQKTNNPVWVYEWNYHDHSKLNSDLNQILNEIEMLLTKI